MADEVFYLGYDNSNDFQLKSDGAPLTDTQMDAITAIHAFIGSTQVTSTNQAGDAIRWAQTGYADGEIRCQFGEVDVEAPSSYTLYFIVYDPTNPDGVVFGPIAIDALNVPL